MIVDTSALIAVLLDEAGAERIFEAIVEADSVMISSVNYVECGIVVDNRAGAATSRRLDAMLSALEVEIVPVTAEQARLARVAHRDFGRRSGSPARLNFGDCFAYALAAESGEELLFKGDDFTATDVTVAPY